MLEVAAHEGRVAHGLSALSTSGLMADSPSRGERTRAVTTTGPVVRQADTGHEASPALYEGVMPDWATPRPSSSTTWTQGQGEDQANAGHESTAGMMPGPVACQYDVGLGSNAVLNSSSGYMPGSSSVAYGRSATATPGTEVDQASTGHGLSTALPPGLGEDKGKRMEQESMLRLFAQWDADDEAAQAELRAKVNHGSSTALPPGLVEDQAYELCRASTYNVLFADWDLDSAAARANPGANATPDPVAGNKRRFTDPTEGEEQGQQVHSFSASS